MRRRDGIGVKLGIQVDFMRIGTLGLGTDISLQAVLQALPAHIGLEAVSLLAVFKEKGFAFGHHIPGKGLEEWFLLDI